MNTSSDKVEALFQAAVALETEAQRAEYLNRACSDPELRREVESLLAAHDHPDPLLATRPEPARPTIKLDLPEAHFDVADVARHFPQLEILELLGQGGMGVVFKARQPQLDRLVALKIMLPEFGKDPRFAERFTREARALAKLNHPNIVAVYEFGQAGGGPVAPASAASEPGSAIPATGGFFYFLMEYVEGANLRAMLRGGRLTPEQAFAIVPKICDALQFAHDEGIMHRDIKPENILIDKRGRVKIADFGLAKILGRETAGAAITVSGVGMGTPRYMAPEQIEDAKTVDHRADIYSLGVVFYEMLTGELPLGRFAPPSHKVQVDVRLDEVVLHTLEKDPGRRYQHASEVKTAVEQISTTTPAAVPPFVPVVPPPAAPVKDAATDAARHVRGPAFAVMVIGFHYLTGAAQFAVAGLLDPIQNGLLRGRWSSLQEQDILPLAAVLPFLVLGILALVGGWKMMHLSSRGLAVLANVITLPVGFWGLAVLSKPDVRSAFTSGAEPPKHPLNRLGHLSLWTAITGMVQVLLLAIMVSTLANVTEGLFLLGWALGVLLEVVALGCGIVARHTGSGKAGIIISSILLLLYVAVYLMAFARVPARIGPTPSGPVESHGPAAGSSAGSSAQRMDEPEITTLFGGHDWEGLLAKTGVDGVEFDNYISSSVGGKSLKVTADGPTVVRLFEEASTVPLFEETLFGVKGARFTGHAQARVRGVEGQVFLEMRYRYPGGEELVCRNTERPLSGTVEWSPVETSFVVNGSQEPVDVKLNLVIEGKGTVWIERVCLTLRPPLARSGGG